MAFTPNQPSPFSFTNPDKAVADKKTAAAEKPVSLYTPKTSSFQSGATARPSTFGTQTAERRPFTSLRAQSAAPDANSGSTLSRFARPAATQTGATPSRPASSPLAARQPLTSRPTTGGTARPAAASPPRAASPFRKDLHITDEEF
ncbi:MAG: hypothetical protein K2H64_10925, partial [Desulfovibrio sp.]|nr:hypothetical protein [Desulfovibrio sp.]